MRVHRIHRTLDALPLFEEMIVTGAWWDFVDEIAARLIGELLERYPKPMRDVLSRWSRDDDIWKRRSAILAQLKFKQATVATHTDRLSPLSRREALKVIGGASAR